MVIVPRTCVIGMAALACTMLGPVVAWIGPLTRQETQSSLVRCWSGLLQSGFRIG